MRLLSGNEIKIVSGNGILVAAIPVAAALILGGPITAGYALATLIATYGAGNLEHLSKHKEIPDIHQMFRG